MTFLNVYVGTLDDPDFSWDGGDWTGNAPRRIGPPFPSLGSADPFRRVQKLIDEGVFPGKQTDWGAWVVIVSPTDLARLLHSWYGTGATDPTVSRWSDATPAEILSFVSRLDPSKRYALVALET